MTMPSNTPPVIPKCPDCGALLHAVRDTGGYLNPDQFASIRAGDWYCDRCTGTRAGSGYRYFWDSELPAAPAVSGVQTPPICLPTGKQLTTHQHSSIPHTPLDVGEREEVKRLAREASITPPWYNAPELQDRGHLRANAEFIAYCTPARIARLVAEVERATEALEGVSHALESLVDPDMAHDDPARAARIVAEMVGGAE